MTASVILLLHITHRTGNFSQFAKKTAKNFANKFFTSVKILPAS
jgi:hypothetical protein